MADMATLESALVGRYEEDGARAICSENALRTLRALWSAGG
jgi:hypothetical protein